MPNVKPQLIVTLHAFGPGSGCKHLLYLLQSGLVGSLLADGGRPGRGTPNAMDGRPVRHGIGRTWQPR